MTAALRRLALLPGLFLLACSSTPVIEGPAPTLLPPPASVRHSADPPPGKLYKDDVARFIDLGFPNFLQRLDVQARIENDKFVGWTLLGLYPPEFWANVDLQPQDVVVSVNGRRIERDTEAYDTFQAVKNERRLVVKYLRGGVPREIGFDIIQRPAPPGGVAVR